MARFRRVIFYVYNHFVPLCHKVEKGEFMPARIIFKAHYLSGEKSKHIENYIQYMGTRPGVEIFEDDGSPVTEKQEQLIAQLIEDFGKEICIPMTGKSN